MSEKRRRRRRGSGNSSDEDEDDNSATASDHEYESAAEEDSALEESDGELANSGSESPKKEMKSSTPLIKDSESLDKTPDENLEEVLDVLSLEDEGDRKVEILEEERGAGDGQEEKDDGKVDDDEDRRNPQYIPKKGMFYEHDDRIDEDVEINDEVTPESTEIGENGKPKRVPRSEKIERWGHDKFLEREQAPKTKEELVSVYGYDIRNEDSAPRARRRRRYGRGPNKYTRDWTDEKAYESSAPVETRKTSSNTSKETQERNSTSTRGGAGSHRGRGGANNVRNDRNTEKGVRLNDKNDFPELKSDRKSDKEETVAPLPKPKREDSTKAPARGSNRGRGSVSNRGDRGGSHNSTKPLNSSVNNRLNKEPKPLIKDNTPNSRPRKVVEKAVEAKLEPLVIKDSPKSQHRKAGNSDLDMDNNSRQPKRYSNTRQHRSNNVNQEVNQPRGGSRHQQDSYTNFNEMNGGPSNPTNNFATANFPTTANGPPPAAPFLPAGVAAASATPTSTAGFLDPTAMVNYGPPPPVQFAPVGVPVTVTVPLVSVPSGGGPHDTLAVLAPPLGTPSVTSPDQVLLASHQGYAEVRGGVTYFNPTAQPPVMPRPVSKRPKAAIPIVDPSQVQQMSPQSSTEDSNVIEVENNHNEVEAKT